MPSPFDMEQMRSEAVLEFSSRRRKVIDESHQKELTPEESSRAEMQAKVNAAKLHAAKEMDKFRDIMENAREEIEKLSMFRSVGDTLYDIGVHQMLEDVIQPVLKGIKPYGMPEDFFKIMRRDMFKTLINRYIDKVGDNVE